MKLRRMKSSRLQKALIVVATGGLLGVLSIPVLAHCLDLAEEHCWLPWPATWSEDHPLADVIEGIFEEGWERQPAWKLPMLVNGLQKEAEQCHITAYCSACPDAGTRTRWSSRARQGIAAADPRYWGPGSVIWMGPPLNKVLIIEDTGGAIKGPHRFDVCMEGAPHMCRIIGRRDTFYVPLHRVPPTSRWGKKPAGWEPPVWVEAPPCDEEQL